MATTTWKGFLNFGMISAPVKLFVAARSESVSFNQLHAACGGKINQDKVCRTCDNVKLGTADIVKGLEVEKGKFVQIADAEIAALAPKSSNVMAVDHFVDLDDVDPILFDKSYFMVPDEAGKKVYSMLCETMKGIRKGAIVKITMSQREHLAIIRPYKNGLTLHTLYYQDEVRAISEFSGMTEEISDAERNMAAQLLNASTKPFDAAAYSDTFQASIKALVESKKNGTAAPVAVKAAAPVVDLMAQLAASLSMVQPQVVTPVKAEAPKAVATKKKKVA